MRFYRGDFKHGDASARNQAKKSKAPARSLVERSLPWLPPRAATVAVVSLQALMRAAEVRLMLLSPLILIVVFVAFALNRERELPAELRPLMAVASVFLAVVGVFQMSQNQFGFDRQGFRAWILAPVDRRDLLLGKNVVLWIIGGAFGLAGLIASACLWPLSPWDLMALVLQIASAMLVVSLMGNLTSTIAPIQVKSGGLESKSPSITTVFLQMVLTVVTPLMMAPIALPAASAWVLGRFGYASQIPWNLLASLVVFVLCVGLYRLLLPLQARLLLRREQAILEKVAATVER